ncbi:MAG: putative Ig domain-containing protein [Acidimicrobiia bacterium]
MATQCEPPASAVIGEITTLVAESRASDTVSLSWVNATTNATAIEVQRAQSSEGGCGSYQSIAKLPADSTSFLDTRLSPSSTHCYRIRGASAYDGGSFTSFAAATVATLGASADYLCSRTNYSWVDGLTGGETINSQPRSAHRMWMPFDATIYGSRVQSLNVNAAGYVRFDGGDASWADDSPLPSANGKGVIAPLWDAWIPIDGTSITTKTVGDAPNRRFVVQWNNIGHNGSPANEAVTFQLIVDEATSAITFQYLDTSMNDPSLDNGASAAIGITRPDGSSGTQYSYHQANAASSTAVRCVVPGAVAVPSQTLPTGVVGSAYQGTLQASGGYAPYRWSVTSGLLPAGLSLAPLTGVISGTPSATGNSSFTLTATDAHGATASRAFDLSVVPRLVINTASLASAQAGSPYRATIAVMGGNGARTFALVAGSLPTGMQLDAATGVISGRTNVAGEFAFTLRVSDRGGQLANRALVLDVRPGGFSKTSARLVGSAMRLAWSAATGTASYEVCVDTTDNKKCDGPWTIVSGRTTLDVKGLKAGTRYFWQVRARSAGGVTESDNARWLSFLR